MRKSFLILSSMLFCLSVKSQVVFGSFQEVLDYADKHSISIRISEEQQAMNVIREK
ncbi:MAG: hypothetical protein AB7E26_02260 [Chryseobacterium sp.]